MLSLQKISIPAASAALFTLGTITPGAAATLYSITELPFTPADINNRSQIVGEQYLWENGNLTNLNTLNGANGSSLSANAINNNGAIAGGGLDNDQAFISNGTTITPLPRLDYCATATTRCLPTTARDINDAGTVALLVDNRSAYIQQPNGSTTNAFFFGTSGVSVGAINNNDKLVGSTPSTGRSGPAVGVLYNSANNTQSRLIAPGYCTGFSSPCFSDTTATDINNVNQVVGAGSTSPPSSDSPIHALLWNNPENNLVGTDLGTLGGKFSLANGINDSSQVVGYSDTDSETQHAFLWENGTLTDLNNIIKDSSGWELTSAAEINNQGEIVGTGYLNQKQSGFLLTPVPESTSTLGILAFGAFGWRSRLKRRQQQKKLVIDQL